ncbi:MAG: hypothetical protein ABIR46_04010 [Candidatus Saccharimonadales bacterium]
MDLVDQLNEASSRVVRSTTITGIQTFTYVFQIKGRWYDGSFTGRVTDCMDLVVKEIKDLGADIDKIRWTRGYLEDGSIKMHPKTDSVAEAKLLEVMKRNARR